MSLIRKNNNDPLGLGIKKQIPENYLFSIEENNKLFTRSLLTKEAQKKLDEEGILHIEQVRALIIENSIKETTLLDIKTKFISYYVYIK